MIKKIAHKSWLTCLLFGNIGLVLILLVQIGLAGWLLAFGKFDVPNFVMERIRSKLLENGIVFEIADIKINFRGYLGFKKLDLRFVEDEKPFLTAENVVIGFRPWELLGENAGISSVKAGNINLYSPAAASPTGKRMPILSNLYVSANRFWEHWNVRLLKGNLGALKFLAHGSVELSHLKFGSGEKHLAAKSVRAQYYEYSRQIAVMQQKLSGIEEPFITMQLDSSEDFPLRFDILYFSNGLRYSLEHELELGPHSLQGGIGLDDSWNPHAIKPARVQIDSVRYGDFVQTQLIDIQARWDSQSMIEAPTYAACFVYDIESYGLDFESLVAVYHEQRPYPISTQLSINHGSNWLELSGDISLEDKTAQVFFDSHWNPMFFFDAKPIKDAIDTSKISFKGAPKWTGTAYFGPGWKFDKVDFSLDTQAFRYETLDVVALHTEGTYKEQQIWLWDTAIHTPRYTVTGTYWQNLKNSSYRFLLDGNLAPLDISFIVDEDWWPELWHEFKFGKELPAASIDLRGRYAGGMAYKWMFGYVHLPECTYRGVPIESATAYLWQLPTILDLLDLYVKTEGHTALVNLQWHNVPHGEDHYSLGISGAGNIPFRQLAKIVPEAEEYSQLFDTDTPPSLRLSALGYGADSDRNGQLYINFYCNYTEPVVFEGVNFDSLQFQGFSTPYIVDLPLITMGLADGTAHGNAILFKHEDADPSLQFSAALKDAKGDLLMAAIPFLHEDNTKKDSDKSKDAKSDNGDDAKSEDADAKKKKKKKSLGIVDFSISGDGTIGDIDSFRGAGKLLIKKGHLGKLNLFGGLLSFMSSVGIDLGTVVFTGVKTDFIWKDGFIHLPNGEIYGPTARIDANGNYDIDDQDLDFLLTIHPLGSFSIPVLAQLLDALSPLANTIQIKLKGTIDKPDWSVDFTPLNIFTGEDEVGKPKPKQKKKSAPKKEDS